jgi:hypothetical protein
MNFTPKRILAAAAVGVAAIVTPVALAIALPGVGGAPASSAATGTPASPDRIVYEQTTGNAGTYVQYVPGDGSKPTNQAITGGGGCGTPTAKNPPPILPFSAALYNGTYTSAPTSAIVGSYKSRTGVCAISPAWAIDNSGSAAEALDFTLTGANASVIGSNREFGEAQLLLARGDKGTGTSTVDLVEYAGDHSGTPLATQSCTVPAGATSFVADTVAASGGCTGAAPVTFNTLEIRVLTAGTSVSVVGPTSTFTLASMICGGQSISSTGPVTATLSLPAGAGCKSYTAFTSGANGAGQQVLSFDGYSTSPVPFTVQITWPAVPECQPFLDASQPPAVQLPQCAPTQLSFDGIVYYDQTYCQGATAAGLPQQGLCTTNKAFNNLDPATGQPIVAQTAGGPVPGTQIVETWTGDIDWYMR